MKEARLGKKERRRSRSTFCMILFIPKSRNCKLTYSDSKYISGCLGMGVGRGRRKGIINNMRKLWGMFTILTAVMVSWCIYLTKLIEVHTLNLCSLFYVTYTFINIFFLKKNGIAKGQSSGSLQMPFQRCCRSRSQV